MSEDVIVKLSDKDIIPTDDYIFSIIGERKILWLSLMNYLQETYKDISGTWNYYNDGKQWLYKLVQKKKTVFWLGLVKYTFRITFYFGDKAEPVIYASDIPDYIKDSFKTGKRYGKIRAIQLRIDNPSDVEIAKKVIAVKMKIR